LYIWTKTRDRDCADGEDLKPTSAGADEHPMATTEIPAGATALQDATEVAFALQANLEQVIRGKRDALRLATVAALSGGHVLLEDVPGVGKTLLAKAIAKSIHGSFRRIQGTPDLLPADLTGVSVLDQTDATWRFRPGPLFANVVLVDEINRATPRTQSALLEAMEEGQVSADGATRKLPDPFVVIATQNPHEHAGTFPLVEGQRDRFAIAIELGLPDRDAEREILTGSGGNGALDELQPVTDAEQLRRASIAVGSVHVAPLLVEYLLDIVAATRAHDGVSLGASPRASVSALRTAQAHAVADGRRFVTPDDIKAVAPAALAHRLILSGGPDLTRGRAVIDAILRRLPPPRG
jgi:MoxR-like ATPase